MDLRVEFDALFASLTTKWPLYCVTASFFMILCSTLFRWLKLRILCYSKLLSVSWLTISRSKLFILSLRIVFLLSSRLRSIVLLLYGCGLPLSFSILITSFISLIPDKGSMALSSGGKALSRRFSTKASSESLDIGVTGVEPLRIPCFLDFNWDILNFGVCVSVGVYTLDVEVDVLTLSALASCGGDLCLGGLWNRAGDRSLPGEKSFLAVITLILFGFLSFGRPKETYFLDI